VHFLRTDDYIRLNGMMLVIHYVFSVSMAIIHLVMKSMVLVNCEFHDSFVVYPVMRKKEYDIIAAYQESE
jgi:hypothetical protein